MIASKSINQQSSEAWKIINEITGRKAFNNAKLKALNDEERLKLWKTHFETLLGGTTDTDESTINNISPNLQYPKENSPLTN